MRIRTFPGRLLMIAALCSLALPEVYAQQAGIQLKGPPEPQSVSPLLASEIPEQLDAYARATTELSRLSARFQDHYQAFIRTLDRLRRTQKPIKGDGACLPAELSGPYNSAREVWEIYHRQARSVRSVQRRLEAFSAAGYAAGLTPDLQDRLKRTLEDYDRTRQEHINLQSVVVQQLESEVERLGCDPFEALPNREVLAAQAAEKPKPAPVAAKPKPVASKPKPAPSAQPDPDEDPEASGPSASALPMDTLKAEEIISAEGLVPVEESPSPSPEPTKPEGEAVAQAPAAADAEAGGEKPADGGADETKPGKPEETPKAGGEAPNEPPPPGPAALQVEFSVDNRMCTQSVTVFLDGRKLGVVAGQQQINYTSTEGRHTLCLGREGDKAPCKQPGDLIKVILYDGFAVRPRC